MGICHLKVGLENSSSPARVEDGERHAPPQQGGDQGELGAANPESLTLAAGAIVAWGALVTVCSLEVGFADAHPHPRVFATGVAFCATGVAIAVWSRDTQQTPPDMAVS